MILASHCVIIVVRKDGVVVDSHTYKNLTLQKLYMMSAARCMNPLCSRSLVVPLGGETQSLGDENSVLIKQIAHIHSERQKGPRYVSGMSIDDLRSYDNLILLCPDCHTAIDTHPEKFPAETLKEWRMARESEILKTYGNNRSLLHTVIEAISNDETFDVDGGFDGDLVPYQIQEKIAYNALKRNAHVIREYSMYGVKLHTLYKILEEQCSFRKLRLMRYVKSEYLIAKSTVLADREGEGTSLEIVRSNSDEIFDIVHKALMEKVKLETRNSLSYEEAFFGTLIVMVDAFMECKIMEVPAP